MTKDINTVKNIIEGYHAWNFTLDRDFEEERKEKPEIFDYESVHYVVRLKEGTQEGDTHIVANLPCEIQIRK